MFGLYNFRGSCWVNACLQGIFRIPDVKNRYSNNLADTENSIDTSIQTIWNTQGKNGLKDFFGSVKHVSLPVGRNVGDSHELLIYLLDKLPWLDSLCRFKVADQIICKNCSYKSLKEDSKNEFCLFPSEVMNTIIDCISNEVKEVELEDSKCEKCSKQYYKQLLLVTFPKILILHVYTEPNKTASYSSMLMINQHKYSLISVLCYNGSHWWAYGRDEVGSPWCTLDDSTVKVHNANEFPLSNTMRILIYYLNE
jgi:ubiquitin C-terminal hydrolase